MPQISYADAFSAATLSTPDAYINVRPPSQGVVKPASFGVLGLVGMASWGPVNAPQLIGTTTQLVLYGPLTARAMDLVTAATVVLVQQQAAGTGPALYVNRVTDGTDTAAMAGMGGNSIGLTARCTGVVGNTIKAQVAAGSRVGTWRMTVLATGFQTELWDNIPAGSTPAATWGNIVAAINSGNASHGPSALVVAVIGATGVANAGANTPVAATGVQTLTGGTDGGTPPSSAMVGVDTVPRTGIYAFRNSGVSDVLLADFSDTTQEPNLVALAQSEGIYAHTNGPPGETPTAAAAAKAAAGTDNPWIKRYLGDWTYWQDNTNNQLRMIGPATFGAGLISALPPQRSGLNKQVFGVVSTQRSRTGAQYGSDEIAVLVAAGIDVICNPIPAGSMFGLRTGQNASSDAARDGDNYPRLTSFIARSLAGPGALGTMIGAEITPGFFTRGYDLLDAYLSRLVAARAIQGYSITFGPQNNPPVQTAAGLVVAEVLVRFLDIARVFLVNLTTGQTVVLPSS